VTGDGDSTPMKSYLRRLSVRSNLTAEEQEAILALPGETLSTAAHRDIVRPGQLTTFSCLVVDGLAARFDQLSNGHRQISALHIVGDFCDLHSLAVPEAGWGIQSLTPTVVRLVPHDALRKIISAYPNVAMAFWRDTVVDNSVLAKWLSALGRRDATARFAHLICEMGLRYEHVQLGTRERFAFPITQMQLADVLGMSSVHINRVLQALRGQGVLETRGQVFHILDRRRLEKLADFDDAYLLERKNRAS